MIVTNNPQVAAKFDTRFVDGSYGKVLEKVRQLIVQEHRVLLSHPLSSSLKPNEMYYKTIILAATPAQAIDLESLAYIESALEVYEQFSQDRTCPKWTEKGLADFALVDFSITRSTLERIGGIFLERRPSIF